MIRNGCNKKNPYQNNIEQLKLKKQPTNFAKSTSPILTHQENNYFYNAKINRIIFQEIKTVNKAKHTKISLSKPLTRSLYESQNNSNSSINKFQKSSKTKNQNSYQVINNSHRNKNLKDSNSNIIDTNISRNLFYCSNVKFVPNTNMNDYNKLKNNNNIGNNSKKCTNNSINNSISNNGIIVTLKTDKNNFYNKKENTRKNSLNSKKDSKFKIYNNEIPSMYNDNSCYYSSSTNDKIFKNKNMSTNYSNNSKNNSDKKFHYKNKINNSLNIINVYDRKKNCNIKKKILTSNNSNNEIYVKIEPKSLQKKLHENLIIFCEKIENFYLNSFKKLFAYFIINLKQYQNKKDFLTNRSLILRRICDTKKRHHHASMSNDHERFKKKYPNKDSNCNNNRNNIKTKKIDNYQKNIINSLMNVSQESYIQIFNELFKKPANHEQKQSKSPLPDNNFDEIKINFNNEKNKNLNKSIGEDFLNNYNSKANIFRNYCSPSGNIFNKYKSSYNFDFYNNNNKFIQNNNNIKILRNYNDENNIKSSKHKSSINRSFDCNFKQNPTMKNNRNFKNYINNNSYINSDYFDHNLNNFSNVEDENKKINNMVNDIDNSRTGRNEYILNSSNVYTKPVLKKTTAKNEEEIKGNAINKNMTVYNAKTFLDLPRRSSQDNAKNVLKSIPNEKKVKININNNQLKEKIIKNVSTRDRRLHVYIKYIFYEFNRDREKQKLSKDLNLLKSLKNNKNVNLNKLLKSSFDISKYIVKHNISITLLSKINYNYDNEILEKKSEYFLNAIIFLTDLLQNLYNDNKKLMVFNFIKNLRKIRNNKLLHQNLFTNKNKINIAHTKINSENNFNAYNNLSNFKPSPNVSSSNNEHNSDNIQNISNKNKKENNYLNLTSQNSYYPDSENQILTNHFTDKKKNSVINYNYRATERKKNKCVTEVKPMINLKMKNKKLIPNTLNNNCENIKENNAQNLEKLKKIKLSKLFNNLDKENHIINTIKNQFLDWTLKNNNNIVNNNNQYNNDDNKYEEKTFNMINQHQKKEVDEKNIILEEDKNNKYDKRNYVNDKNYVLKKDLTNL